MNVLNRFLTECAIGVLPGDDFCASHEASPSSQLADDSAFSQCAGSKRQKLRQSLPAEELAQIMSRLTLCHEREAEGPLAKQVLKGTRWLLLKNPENLAEEKDERKRLEKALALNKPLATAYYMKEDLRQIWDQRDRQSAEVFLDDWIARARKSGIRMLMHFAETLTQHRTGILNYYKCRITTAPLEGTNNKIKTMQRQAYGFRDTEFFRLRIFSLHETRYALVG